MNRRSFLRTASAAALSALVPTWLPERTPPRALDLTPFCQPWQHPKYDMAKPFVQGEHELHRYATDSRICVRVPATEADKGDSPEVRRPDAAGLGWWQHDALYPGRWQPWPAARYRDAADSDCQRCHGTGDLHGISRECEACQGVGTVDCDDDWGFYHPTDCQACKGLGFQPLELCPECQGKAIGIFPALQPLAGVYVDAKYDRRIRAHLEGVEVFVPRDGLDSRRPLKFRFNGGVGLLMPVETKAAEERIRRAGR